ncbi:DUF7344 domain-containing protein [Halomarina rubra]|uniref:DUF7344 domain-containing protein n=1 Tax=Halomarina rubra TaxID=2071873 RepID=A0ABD6AZP1_9EURY|nr:hypothetical protein [Halomarina rubra]
MKSEMTATTAHDLLETETRRQVVALMLEVEREWDVRELAAELTRLDPTASTDDVERVAIRLYHCALPKLADADAVDFDAETKTVESGRLLPALGAHLDDLLGHDDRVDEKRAFVASV